MELKSHDDYKQVIRERLKKLPKLASKILIQYTYLSKVSCSCAAIRVATPERKKARLSDEPGPSFFKTRQLGSKQFDRTKRVHPSDAEVSIGARRTEILRAGRDHARYLVHGGGRSQLIE